MSGLEVAATTVRFGEATALDRVDLAVAVGEVIALVGPSGCGKSTLLRAIAGLQPIDAGRITWDGTDLTSVPPHQRDIGLMFQDHALFTHRDVGDNVAFGLKMRDLPKPDQRTRVDELLELVGLPGYRHRRVDTLSGGEAQRVALARALAPNPRLLLLDEPLGSLDRARRDQLIDELRSLLRELGQTTVHVTHDQAEAFALADRMAVMDAGRIPRIGTPHEVWHDPRSGFVADFIGHVVVTNDAGQRVAVPPDAAAFHPDGRPGTVIDLLFRGDRTEVRVKLDTGEPASVLSPDPPAIGARVHVLLDEAKLSILSEP